MVYWTSDFSDLYENENEEDRINNLYETAWIFQSLTTVIPIYKKYKSEYQDLINGSYNFIIRYWEPDELGLAKMEFRVPTKNGLSGNYISWEPPRDAAIVTAIIEYALTTNTEIESITWNKICKSIVSMIETQHEHGHWNDPLISPPKAFPSNTRWYLRAILVYLKYLQITLKNISS